MVGVTTIVSLALIGVGAVAVMSLRDEAMRLTDSKVSDSLAAFSYSYIKRDAAGVATGELTAFQGQALGTVIAVLRGEDTEKVRERGHHDVTTFGIGADLDDKTWRGIFRQLVARGLLAVDHERYNALFLSDQARPLLRGEAEFLLRLPPEKKRSRREPRFFGRDARNDGLLERLRAWRTDTAKSRNVPAYVIFHDATLMEIAHLRPASMRELSGISGVGDRKLEAYGEQILALVQEEAATGLA